MKRKFTFLGVICSIELKKFRNAEKQASTNRIFVIGDNKTGTTILESVLKSFGIKMGNQAKAEMLYLSYLINGDSKDILDYCTLAEGFQDVPFSKGDLYKDLDERFPGSKFILTVRDSPEQWYESLARFHGKKWSKDKNHPPSVEDLKMANYRFRGYPYLTKLLGLPKVSPEDWYDKQIQMDIHKKRNDEIREYFRLREKDFIEINVSKSQDFQRLVRFLGVKSELQDFPHKNKT